MAVRSGRSGAIELQVTLRDVEPSVWRTIAVPAGTDLHTLHHIIQEVMGWEDMHLYEFRVGATRYEAPSPEAEGVDASKTTLAGLTLKVGDSIEYTYDFGDEWVHDLEVLGHTPQIGRAHV